MKKLIITGSVGIGGVNNYNDIKALQSAVNMIINQISPVKKLSVDGRLGARPEMSKTVAAIKEFQRKIVGLARPDGRIDVNGKSHRKINEKLSALAISRTAITSTSAWMKTALSEVGESEVEGKEANPKILEYFKSSKFWGTDDSGGANAWCGSFVAWVMKENGYMPVDNAFRAKEWKTFGKEISQPVYGAIGIKSRNGGGHVAFVVGKSSDDKYLYMLGGNQGNMVQVKRYQASVWDTFVVPSSFIVNKGTLPVYTKEAADAGSEA